MEISMYMGWVGWVMEKSQQNTYTRSGTYSSNHKGSFNEIIMCPMEHALSV